MTLWKTRRNSSAGRVSKLRMNLLSEPTLLAAKDIQEGCCAV